MSFLKNIIFLKILLLLSFIQITKADTKLLMLTDKKCMYCIVWEKQIGEIYNKTEISSAYPLKRYEASEINENFKNKIFKTSITPTFVFFNNGKEVGRIIGYSNPEMFWWQVDEILEKWLFVWL